MTRIGQASSLKSLRASLKLGLPSKGLRPRPFKIGAHCRSRPVQEPALIARRGRVTLRQERLGNLLQFEPRIGIP